METEVMEIQTVDVSKVLTVPMRNGNLSPPFTNISVPKSSYRTYEEWKLLCEVESSIALKVLTVPMRNGNS